jgi:hypothetical protein
LAALEARVHLPLHLRLVCNMPSIRSNLVARDGADAGVDRA